MSIYKVYEIPRNEEYFAMTRDECNAVDGHFSSS
jgi:hypothetical protein